MATMLKKSRQERVYTMLENQLKEGTKTVKKSSSDKTPLTDSDIKRIKKEMELLKR